LGNTVFKISNHFEKNKTVEDAIERIFNSWNWEPVEEFGIKRWKQENGFRFQVSSTDTFIKTFQGSYENMEPHNNNPAEAFDLCVQKKCPMLLDGKMYKCGTLALMPELLERFNWPNKDKWNPYIIDGIDVNCNEKELENFVNNFGKPHKLCSQCPSKKDIDSIIDHKKNVKFKSQKEQK